LFCFEQCFVSPVATHQDANKIEVLFVGVLTRHGCCQPYGWLYVCSSLRHAIRIPNIYRLCMENDDYIPGSIRERVVISLVFVQNNCVNKFTPNQYRHNSALAHFSRSCYTALFLAYSNIKHTACMGLSNTLGLFIFTLKFIFKYGSQ
jgi:hypothetical protein